MAARMLFGCLTVSLVLAAGRAVPVQGQYLYAGPGTVVQRQYRGPFVYEVPRRGVPGQVPPLGYPGPRVFVPAPGPYLEAPVIVPPGGYYVPHPYRPGYVTPFGIPVQPDVRPYGGYVPQPYSEYPLRPYGGYQPNLDRPRFADPYAQPRWLDRQTPAPQMNATQTVPPTAAAGPTEVPASDKPSGAAQAQGDVKAVEGAPPAQSATPVEPNRPE